MPVQLVLLGIVTACCLAGWTLYWFAQEGYQLLPTALVNRFVVSVPLVTANVMTRPALQRCSLRKAQRIWLAKMRRFRCSGTREPVRSGPAEPRVTRDIKREAGLTDHQKALLEAVRRGEKVLTAKTSGKEWAKAFATRPETVYAELRHIDAEIATEALAASIADPTIEVPPLELVPQS